MQGALVQVARLIAGLWLAIACAATPARAADAVGPVAFGAVHLRDEPAADPSAAPLPRPKDLPVERLDPRKAYAPRKTNSIVGGGMAALGLAMYFVGVSVPDSLAAAEIGFLVFTVGLPIQYAAALDGTRVIRRAGLRPSWAPGALAVGAQIASLTLVGLGILAGISSFEGNGSPLTFPLLASGGGAGLVAFSLGVWQIAIDDKALRREFGTGAAPVDVALFPIVSASTYGLGASIRF